jgi:hypothetical protein
VVEATEPAQNPPFTLPAHGDEALEETDRLVE